MTQLNINVTKTERERFDSYAAALGLHRTSLANLLLRRALAGGKLAELLATEPPNGRLRDARITAHLTEELWGEFVAKADEMKVSHSSAGALVLLAELDEKWLERAVYN